MAELTCAWLAEGCSPRMLVKIEAVVGFTSFCSCDEGRAVENSKRSASRCSTEDTSSGIARSLLARFAIKRRTGTTAKAAISSMETPELPTTPNTKFNAVNRTSTAATKVADAASRGARGSWTTSIPHRLCLLGLLVCGQAHFCGTNGVFHEHCDGHWANTTRYG